MNWKKIAGNTEVIETRGAMIPVYWLSENRVVMIDSGAERSPELIEAMETEGIVVSAVLCTHFHPDHTANNSLLVERFGTKIYAPAVDICEERFRVIRHGDVRLSKNCLSEVPDYPIFSVGRSGRVEIEGENFEVVDTAGHTEGHLAYVTPDGVCCVGDALVSEKELKQMKLPYLECAETAVKSMKKLLGTSYPYYVISHGSVESRSDISKVIQSNIEKEEEILCTYRKKVFESQVPQEISEFLKAVGITRPDYIENRLLQESAKARLNILAAAGEIMIEGDFVSPIGDGETF